MSAPPRCPCEDYHRAMDNYETCLTNGLPRDHPLASRYWRRAQLCKRLTEKSYHPMTLSRSCPLGKAL